MWSPCYPGHFPSPSCDFHDEKPIGLMNMIVTSQEYCCVGHKEAQAFGGPDTIENLLSHGNCTKMGIIELQRLN